MNSYAKRPGPPSGKRKKKISPVVIPVTLLLLLAAVSVFFVILHVMGKAAKTPAGIWERRIPLSASAEEKASAWLSGAKMSEKVTGAFSVEYEDPALILCFREDGTFEQYPDRDSYEKMRKALYGQLEDALRNLIILRIGAADLGTFSKEEADRAFEEEFGMGIPEYLSEYGPGLLPSFEELSAEYEAEGTWRIEDGLLIRNEGKGEELLYDENMLAIREAGKKEAAVYVRRFEKEN
ncbi:MAG: hypothetical protein K6F53_01070 [Lachnospiraceae bacterium]|nr:hypothetical protein [Lachnospiraceae bacterium]